MSDTSAAKGPDRSASRPTRMVSSVTPKSVSTSAASPPAPVSPPASSSSSSPPQPAAISAAASSMAMSLRVALITLPCWDHSPVGHWGVAAQHRSVAERPPLPVVAHPDPDAEKPERLEDEERHDEQHIEDLVELEDRDARPTDGRQRDQAEVVAPHDD